jgi:DNA-binding transcriptional MerR regulator
MKSKAIVRLADLEQIYSPAAAARLARISLDFLHRCEQEGLFPHTPGSGRRFSAEEITHLTRVRRLHDDLGLDLPAIAVVLHMRQRILELMTELEEIERDMAQREKALRSEIHWLRTQTAHELDFEDSHHEVPDSH